MGVAPGAIDTGRGLLLAWLMLGAGPALADTVTVSGACVRRCEALSGVVRANPPAVQACLIRCNAGQAFDRSVPPRAPSHGLPTAADTRGPGAPSRSAAASVTRPPAAYAWATAPLPAVPAAPATRSAAADVPVLPAPTGRWGAAYLATAPAQGFGLSVGRADRLMAHVEADRACNRAGMACRPAREFAEPCGAIAQARHTRGMVRTTDPSTWSVSYAASGAGGNRQVAEAEALANCRVSDRTNACEIVDSRCAVP